MFLTCCCVPNFIEIGSRIRPPDAHNWRMFNAPLLGNGCCHGNRHMTDMSRTWWDAITKSCIPVGPLVGELWHFKYFPTGGRPPFWIIKILIFVYMTVTAVLTCCCVPNFITFGIRVWPPDAHNCRMLNAPLLDNGLCHGYRNMADMSRTWWDATTQVASQLVHW